MSKKARIPVIAAIVLMCCALTFTITYMEIDKVSPTLGGYKQQIAKLEAQIEEQQARMDQLESRVGEVSKYYELKSIIDTYYVGEYEQEDLITMMGVGIVAGIGDRWSYYMDAEGFENYKLANENVYKGVGITISAEYEYGGFEIVRVAEDGPARDAGLQVADVVVAVDGESVIDLDLDTVRSMVQGEDGTQVVITVMRNGNQMDFTTIRGTASYEIVNYEMLDDNMGYVKLFNFEGNSAASFFAAVEVLRGQGAQGFIFDVRNNPGGLMDEMLKILDYLLPEGDTFVQKSVSGEATTHHSDAAFLDMPMVVLVNENSYSAAEYFAAILQEYGAAEVVGMPTTGKGYYQTPIPMADGSAVVLSVGEYFTPSGRSLAETGVTPDYESDLEDEEFARLYYGQLSFADDDQLEQARVTLQTALD